MRKLLAASIAVISVLAGAFAAFGFHGTPAMAAAADYGAGAYTGSNPIGGGDGYVSAHGYSQATADYVVNTWAQFKSACGSATSGDVIWVPSGVTLTMASGDDHPTLKSGVVLASNRGQNGAAGGKLKNPYIVGGSGNYMSPIVFASSNCVISGLTFEGPGSFASTTDSRTNAAIRINSARRVEIENCELANFYQGGIYISGGMPTPWNSDTSTGRHWVHHCTIHGMQRHGFGYGLQVESGASALIEACSLYDCRHLIAASQTQAPGYGNCYEARYNIVGEGWYRYYGTGPLHNNHQFDCHGFGASTSGYAGGYIWIHHNTFAANNTYDDAPNVSIRGIPHYECRIYHNWTKKTTHSGLYSETTTNSAFTLRASDGGAWNGSPTLSTYKMYVYDNWYGAAAPPLTPYTNHAPVLSAVGARSAAAGSALSFTISAYDSDGDSLTFSASNLPSGATFSASSHTFSWTPDSSQAGTYSGVRFQVSDGSLTDYEEITITVTAVATNIDPDINTDGAINSLDMIRVGQHWAETGAGGWIREDINQDGSVSVLDAALVGQHWTG